MRATFAGDDVAQCMVALTDSGRRCQFAHVDVFGVPADGIVDTATDITIMGWQAVSNGSCCHSA